MYPRFKLSHLVLALMACSPATLLAETVEGNRETGKDALQLGETHVVATAEEELKQASGVSLITAEDIKKRPPVNDLSDIVRKMPGVNLTGNSASGTRGNNRQIDLRGMGPENTLILIDGKPVTSRNAVRYTRSGERDTRGDSNWVPANEVERIEVLRGPAAARYGSGSMGGVVNIITKRPTDKLSGSLSAFTNLPEDDAEGMTKRTTFSLSGPLTDALTFRVYGNLNKTDADDADINAGNTDTANGASLAAGREGVRNKDLNGLLSWALDDRQTVDLEAGFSRQGNIYTGDVGTGGTDSLTPGSTINGWLGRETNTMYRQTFSATHRGDWSFGSSRLLAQYEKTRNNRLLEGNTGSVDGDISANASKTTSTYDSYLVQGQLDIPLQVLLPQMLTVGAEWNRQTLDDPSTMNRAIGTTLPNSAAGARATDMDTTIMALFAEDNIELTPDWFLTPGLRLDHQDQFGANWSPSLNTSYKLTEDITLKGGIARAFKAPNLYQSNPNYLYYSRGNGCAPSLNANGCYVLGNENLDPEISINKELGIAFARGGWAAGVTYFRNDYESKIVSSNDLISKTVNNEAVLQWDNAKDAVVKGWEGNLGIPLLGAHGETLSWNTNFTYMQENKDGDGNPLSVVPKYTVNSMLDWQVNEALAVSLTGTWYGKQEPRVLNPSRDSPVTAANEQKTLDPYHIWGVGGTYEVNKNLSLGAGINNLFDKRVYREGAGTSAGASTYNEPGRSFYASITTSF
ncbi:TonB-dependent siderophore receptor [Pseudomonas sp. ANT_H14]|uniref:FepA family TonB-dependent siderophore receptor n=1 Tax=unclassified Pseudomonas TaxID=196821 RepID=UPI0011EC27C9|nr:MULTISPECIES: FepA family TonB-dependent siderophore receptor [unclassified Pseudomonas]KAA0942654.1 TonB-dependent siderophore receptor [Pseudomonas sp. ANT_H4]KAA0948401.1 TonB-dependent siderophore receptor [Pseudomonas sp. ANT_H14]